VTCLEGLSRKNKLSKLQPETSHHVRLETVIRPPGSISMTTFGLRFGKTSLRRSHQSVLSDVYSMSPFGRCKQAPAWEPERPNFNPTLGISSSAKSGKLLVEGLHMWDGGHDSYFLNLSVQDLWKPHHTNLKIDQRQVDAYAASFHVYHRDVGCTLPQEHQVSAARVSRILSNARSQ
jgi:hypothetical protein